MHGEFLQVNNYYGWLSLNNSLELGGGQRASQK